MNGSVYYLKVDVPGKCNYYPTMHVEVKSRFDNLVYGKGKLYAVVGGDRRIIKTK